MGFLYHKNFYRAKTSEDLFGIVDQPAEQCPVIDELIIALKKEANTVDAIKENIRSGQPDIYDIADQLDWVRFNLEQLDIEKLRDAIVKLREWGQGWKSLAENIIEDGDININPYTEKTRL